MNKIRELRQKNGLTQVQLAQHLYIDRSTVAKWETGESNPRADMLTKIAKVLECSIDDLLCESKS